MQMNVAIAGYGNLGKSLEKHILNDGDMNLIAIFSRRNIDNKLRRRFEDADKIAACTDVLLVALGSLNDIAENAMYFKNFHTVDSFDVHAEMKNHKQLLNELKPTKVSVCAAGWDPGMLSIVRGTFAIGKGNVSTFWGSGISQGHSFALRLIRGVLDAVEITQPNEEARTKILRGENVAENERHTRLCYVACVESDKERIEKEIREMPNYFAGQNVKIVFCTKEEVNRLKQTTSHCGNVIATGDGYVAEANLKLESNTDFTSKIMLAYAKAIPQLSRDGYVGALDPFDIPLKYLTDCSLV